MCGIAGVINYKNNLSEEDIETTHRMTSVLKHRGPDGFGFFSDKNVSLGNSRLAIIDPGGQSDLPISSQDNTIWLCYNGEISNFIQLRNKFKLTDKYSFKGKSDSEVIVYLYKELGISFLNELSGMFSFCLYDKRKSLVYLVRDFFG